MSEPFSRLKTLGREVLARVGAAFTDAATDAPRPQAERVSPCTFPAFSGALLDPQINSVMDTPPMTKGEKASMTIPLTRVTNALPADLVAYRTGSERKEGLQTDTYTLPNGVRLTLELAPDPTAGKDGDAGLSLRFSTGTGPQARTLGMLGRIDAARNPKEQPIFRIHALTYEGEPDHGAFYKTARATEPGVARFVEVLSAVTAPERLRQPASPTHSL